MRSRRTGGRALPDRAEQSRWVLVGGPPGRPAIEELRPSVRNGLAGEATVHPVGDDVELESGGSEVFVNDVQVHGRALLRSGDVVSAEGRTWLVILQSSRRAPGEPTLDHLSFTLRIKEELAADPQSFTVLLCESGAFQGQESDALLFRGIERLNGRSVLGTLAPGFRELLVAPGVQADVDLVRAHVTSRAAQGEHAVRWGSAQYPRDGKTAAELWSAAFDRLLGIEPPRHAEVPRIDPTMVRLWNMSERIASRTHALVVAGDEGVGRESLVRGIRELSNPSGPFVVHRAARFEPRNWAQDVAQAAGGALHVRRIAALPESEVRAFFGATAFRPSAGVDGAADARGLQQPALFVPALEHRPLDVVPIAEFVLAAVDGRLARRRSILPAETRLALQQSFANENVRDLRNSVMRAALLVDGREVRPDQLGTAGRSDLTRDVRERVREVELRTLQEALRRTEWNVSEAARLLSLPRRTMVYRMRRLGLRRSR